MKLLLIFIALIALISNKIKEDSYKKKKKLYCLIIYVL